MKKLIYFFAMAIVVCGCSTSRAKYDHMESAYKSKSELENPLFVSPEKKGITTDPF